MDCNSSQDIEFRRQVCHTVLFIYIIHPHNLQHSKTAYMHLHILYVNSGLQNTCRIILYPLLKKKKKDDSRILLDHNFKMDWFFRCWTGEKYSDYLTMIIPDTLQHYFHIQVTNLTHGQYVTPQNTVLFTEPQISDLYTPFVTRHDTQNSLRRSVLYSENKHFQR